MNKFKEPVIGQIMYRLNINNAARGREQELTEVKVIEVKRKYFTVSAEICPFTSIHHLEGGYEKSDYSPDYEIYESAEKWHEKKECKVIGMAISNSFNFGNSRFSYDQLKKVESILYPEGLDDVK